MFTPTTFTFLGGFTVRRIGYGAMRLTGQPGNFGPYADWEAGKMLLRRAVELGVQFIDTARAYGPGWNEELIAEALHPYPATLMIATKGGIEKTGSTSAHIKADGRPEILRIHIEESLKRLRVDCIPLYYLHRPDPNVPFAESLGELIRAKEAGKIARIGLSNVSLEQLQLATTLTPISAVQNRYDPVNRGDDAVLNFTTANGIAFVPWGGLGANPMVQGSPLASGGVSGDESHTPIQRALVALLNHAPNILQIPGTTSIKHLEENLLR